MRIRNEGKRTFLFNGGQIAPNETVDIRNKNIASALLKCYPNELVCLETETVRVIEQPKVEEEAVSGEVVETPKEEHKPAPKKKGGRKSKKAK